MKHSWHPCYTFYLTLFVHLFVLDNPFWRSVLKSFVIYILSGGWRFQRIFLLTIYRDIRGLYCLFIILFNTYWVLFTKETFADLFRRTVRKRGASKVAIYYEDVAWTFGQLDAYSNKVANLLLANGFKRGDTLLLLLQSSPAYVAIWLGAAKIGVRTALVNYNLVRTSLLNSVRAVDNRGCIVGCSLKDSYDAIRSEFEKEHPSTMIWFVDDNHSGPDAAEATTTRDDLLPIANWNRELAKSSHASPPPLERLSNPKEHLIYVYTSGTTGLPKAAIITNMRYILMTSGVRYSFGIYRSDVLYITLPLYHSMGGICGLGQMLLHGTTVAIRSKFSASQFWPDCIKYNCTVVQYIGEICRYLIGQPTRSTDRQHKVRLAFGNGLRRQTWIDFQQRFNVPRIGELYGATESVGSITNTDGKVGAIGFITQLIKGVYPIYLLKMDLIKEEPVRDPTTGLCIECESDEPGQMISRIKKGSPVRDFDGYVNNQANSKKVLHDVFKKGDSWYASGDLLYRDELGYLYFSDRLGDTFRWHGENVSTAEVEEVILKNIPDSSLLTVYGVSVPGCEGKAGMAALELPKHSATNKDGSDASNMIKHLEAVLTKELPAYARPQFIRFCDQIETTGTFKLRKVDMATAGFDPTKTSERIYFMNPRTKCYQELDVPTYEEICSGEIRL